MTEPVILFGTQSNGETLPVQVDATGRLVAEGLPGPEGPPGPPGVGQLPPDPEEGQVLGWLNGELAWLNNSATGSIFTLQSADAVVSNVQWSSMFESFWPYAPTEGSFGPTANAFDGNPSTEASCGSGRCWPERNQENLQIAFPIPFSGTVVFHLRAVNGFMSGNSGKWRISFGGIGSENIRNNTQITMTGVKNGHGVYFGYPGTDQVEYENVWMSGIDLNTIPLIDGDSYQKLTFSTTEEVEEMIEGWTLISMSGAASARIYCKQGQNVWVKPIKGDMAAETSYFQVAESTARVMRANAERVRVLIF